MSLSMRSRLTPRTQPAWLTALWHAASRLLLLLLALLVALSSAIAVATGAVAHTVAQRETYHEVVAASALVERVPALAADMLLGYGRTNEGPLAAQVNRHTHQAWLSVAETLLLPSWLEESLDELTDDVVNWLESEEAATPDIAISLEPVAAILRSDQGALALLPLLERTPPCEAGDTQPASAPGGLPACLPQGADITLLAAQSASQIAGRLPPVVTFATLQESGLAGDDTVQMLARVKTGRRLLQQAATFALRFAVLTLLLSALARSRSPRTLLRSPAAPLLLGAVLAGGALLALHAALRAAAQQAILGSGTMEVVVKDGAAALLQAAQGPWLAGIALLAALALAAASAPPLLARVLPANEAPSSAPRRQQVRRRFR